MYTAYKEAPAVTRERLYLENMENVLQNTNKLYMGSDSNNLMMLPLDKMMGTPTGNTPQANVEVVPSRADATTPAQQSTSPSMIQTQPTSGNANDSRSRARLPR